MILLAMYVLTSGMEGYFARYASFPLARTNVSASYISLPMVWRNVSARYMSFSLVWRMFLLAMHVPTSGMEGCFC